MAINYIWRCNGIFSFSLTADKNFESHTRYLYQNLSAYVPVTSITFVFYWNF